MRVIPGNAQNIGDRANQEDAFGFSSCGDRAFERHAGVMMVLCDGMGGMANGAAASRAAVDAVLAGYGRKTPSEDIPSALHRVLGEAHQEVCAVFNDGGATGGTTIVIAVVFQDHLYWASLGDSRLYLCREGAPAAQLTEDHNLATLIDQSEAGAVREGVSAENREALTAYLGAPCAPQPHMGRDVALRPGDRIVACSDGLYRGLSPQAIAAAARQRGPMRAAESMVDAVLQQRLPHQDNVTVVLFEIAAKPRLTDLLRLPLRLDRKVLSGAAGGIAASICVVVVLIGFGYLKIASLDRPAVATAVPPPSPPATTTANQPAAPDAPSTSAAQGQPTAKPVEAPAANWPPAHGQPAPGGTALGPTPPNAVDQPTMDGSQNEGQPKADPAAPPPAAAAPSGSGRTSADHQLPSQIPPGLVAGPQSNARGATNNGTNK